MNDTSNTYPTNLENMGTAVYRVECFHPKFKILYLDINMTFWLEALWIKAGGIRGWLKACWLPGFSNKNVTTFKCKWQRTGVGNSQEMFSFSAWNRFYGWNSPLFSDLVGQRMLVILRVQVFDAGIVKPWEQQESNVKKVIPWTLGSH